MKINIDTAPKTNISKIIIEKNTINSFYLAEWIKL